MAARGIFLPPFDDLADPARLASLAADAEAAGWDPGSTVRRVFRGVDRLNLQCFRG
jgi:hypothetical protein